MQLKDIILLGTAAVAALLVIQVIVAKRQLGNKLLDIIVQELEPTDHENEINFVMLGDSLAEGRGSDNYKTTPGVLISQILSRELNCRINYFNYAESGATSDKLVQQAADALRHNPDVVLILIGTNDVTSAKNLAGQLKYLEKSIRMLYPAKIYFVPCINLGQIRSIQSPLRHGLRIISSKYCESQSNLATSLGVSVIDSSEILKKFKYNRLLFAADNYHPSSLGFQIIAEHVSNHILNY